MCSPVTLRSLRIVLVLFGMISSRHKKRVRSVAALLPCSLDLVDRPRMTMRSRSCGLQSTCRSLNGHEQTKVGQNRQQIQVSPQVRAISACLHARACPVWAACSANIHSRSSSLPSHTMHALACLLTDCAALWCSLMPLRAGSSDITSQEAMESSSPPPS